MTHNLKIATRKAERKSCRLFGKVKYLNKAVEARIVNLSLTGVALDIGGPLHAATGSRVRVEAEGLGSLEGTIRWLHSGRIGVQFDPNSNASAQVASYFRFFHQDLKPTLSR
ncbi:PilZ domain-containing protein [Rhizobium sp. BK251]|uniref:PilZ domain-containing protein n=1 Tax=Rhizobium sp. BK251 TaxID=2512125 RepID=UPI0010484C3D|nr:PilZ domain-containing protein [Rhizobium sp. BK251]TCL67221.1 PilZ domain-containing protein [Rhizobium sp. BK251]